MWADVFNAYRKELPVVSFIFKDDFCTNAIKGYVRELPDKKGVQGSIRNLHHADSDDLFRLLTNFKISKKKKAQKEPMWNLEMTKKIHREDRTFG